MTNLGAVLEQLKQEHAQLDQAIAVLSKLASVAGAAPSIHGSRSKRLQSVAARKRIAAAQRTRWAKVRQRK